MRQKIKLIGAILLLLGLIVLCQTGGGYLYRYIEQDAATVGNNIKNEKIPTVLIDAGHGGKDPGKIGANNVLEKDINLKISMYVKKYLEKQNIKVIMTREDGERLADSQVGDLKERVRIINEEAPDLAVSIHQNSYHETSVKGTQLFYFTHSKDAKEAADMIQKGLEAGKVDKVRPVKANDTYYLLKKTEVPVVIVECGFLSNYEEAEKLASQEYQKLLAEAIADGVIEYVGK